jgi:hypothetical protein
MVFVARGASVPLIVRPPPGLSREICPGESLDVNTPFTFVGGAYVNGFMDGEVLEMAAQGNWEGQTVSLI